MSVTVKRVKSLLRAARKSRVLVVGDVMLDQFMWGSVKRISPEAPVPVVEFQNETYMPGGAANVARNLTALGAALQHVVDSNACGLRHLHLDLELLEVVRERDAVLEQVLEVGAERVEAVLQLVRAVRLELA